MKSKMTTSGLMLALLCASQVAMANDCREAEERIAEMSVSVADAYGSGDFDKAKSLLSKAAEQSKKGADEAKSCGCEKVKDPLDKADSLMKDALSLGGSFSDVQDRLYSVIGQSETARRAAEVCWRDRVAKGGKK